MSLKKVLISATWLSCDISILITDDSLVGPPGSMNSWLSLTPSNSIGFKIYNPYLDDCNYS